MSARGIYIGRFSIFQLFQTDTRPVHYYLLMNISVGNNPPTLSYPRAIYAI